MMEEAPTPHEVVIDGRSYVPAAALEAAESQRDGLRRTLAMAHAQLVFDGEHARDNAVALIQRQTGWGVGEARGVRQVMLWTEQQRAQRAG